MDLFHLPQKQNLDLLLALLSQRAAPGLGKHVKIILVATCWRGQASAHVVWGHIWREKQQRGSRCRMSNKKKSSTQQSDTAQQDHPIAALARIPCRLHLGYDPFLHSAAPPTWGKQGLEMAGCYSSDGFECMSSIVRKFLNLNTSFCCSCSSSYPYRLVQMSGRPWSVRQLESQWAQQRTWLGG